MKADHSKAYLGDYGRAKGGSAAMPEVFGETIQTRTC